MSVDKTSTKRFARVAILTISDTRCFETDTSGSWLQEAVEAEGHELIDRKVVVDDVYQMRAIVSDWVANPNVEVILTTGGTGFTGRDSTPEALAPLFDKHIEGFGELFRHLSYAEIGTSTVQSRCLAGIAIGRPFSVFRALLVHVKQVGMGLSVNSWMPVLNPVISCNMLVSRLNNAVG